MTALTTMFNFIIVYMRLICCCVFGGDFNYTHFTGERAELAKHIIFTHLGTEQFPGFILPGVPILQLFIAIIVVGAIIGLARRLIRG